LPDLSNLDEIHCTDCPYKFRLNDKVNGPIHGSTCVPVKLCHEDCADLECSG